MQELINFLRTDNYLLILNILIIVLLIGFIALLVSNMKLKEKYKKFMKKLGNGKDIEEDLSNFMYKVDRVEKQNAEIMSFCKSLDDDFAKCLSFAVALLNEENSGVVFNGIYSREMSNIYAKPVEKGNSSYTLSEEEAEAIRKAINSSNIYRGK